jgi:hypothetical protein
MNSTKPSSLQHDGQMPLKERIEESQTYGENYRAENIGPDTRSPAQPTHGTRIIKPNPKLGGDKSQESSGNL